MKRLITLMCGAACWALPAWAVPMVMPTNGPGAAENTAVTTAKRHVTIDMQSAGLNQDSYRLPSSRVIEVTGAGGGYVATVETDLIKDTGSQRNAFLLTEQESQLLCVMDLVQRLCTTSDEERAKSCQILAVAQVDASGTLRIQSINYSDRSGMTEELRPIERVTQASINASNASRKNAPVFLNRARPRSGANKTIRTLREPTTSGRVSLSTQLAAAVRQDMGLMLQKSGSDRTVTLLLQNMAMIEGQPEFIYEDRINTDGRKESIIITHNVITKVTASTVRVATDHPVKQEEGRSWRVTLASAVTKEPRRGVVIKDSDW